MSIRYFFHGTSYQNYINIKSIGFGFCKKITWDCSDDSCTYMYDMEKFIESECMEEEELECQINHTLNRANESAQIVSAFEENPYDRTVVFEFIVDTDKSDFLDYITEDDSCPHMADIGAVIISDKKLNEFIFKSQIKVKVHFFEFFPKLSFAYITGLFDNQYLNYKKETMSEADLKAWELIKDIDFTGLYEEMYLPNEFKKEMEVFN